MTAGIDGVLVVRRSVHTPAGPERVWRELATFEAMSRWWGLVTSAGDPRAGAGEGQRLLVYEPEVAGHIEMEVSLNGAPARYGGLITVFEPGRELTFECDWVPSQGWLRPTRLTLRLQAALGGTLIELLHRGFEHVGGDCSAEHAAYEGGWGMTQLHALRRLTA